MSTARPGDKSDTKHMCHWACCQVTRQLPGNLCAEHTKLSQVLGLKVWPAGT
jgi:hypothetical protein